MSTYLEAYRDEIRRGNIIAGHELITALDTYITDMQNPRYVYDTKEAYKRIEFIETFVKLTKSPFYGKPMKLMLWLLIYVVQNLLILKVLKKLYKISWKIFLTAVLTPNLI